MVHRQIHAHLVFVAILLGSIGRWNSVQGLHRRDKRLRICVIKFMNLSSPQMFIFMQVLGASRPGEEWGDQIMQWEEWKNEGRA